jgi:ubiquinone/menaquinone biosynthesis C-methylase UbiE
VLDNLINRDDLRHLVRRLRRHGPFGLARKLVSREESRVAEAWSSIEHVPTHAWHVPEVLARRNALVTGDPDKQFVDWFVERHLGERSGLVAISVGCGDGLREPAWARTGRFARIDAYDISPGSIEKARERASADGLDGVLEFKVGNAYDLEYPAGSLDVIIGEDSLHHMTPLDELFARFERWLRPDGFLFVNEYVGPRRLQLEPRQLEAANAALALLPEACRRDWEDGGVRRRIDHTGRLRMYLNDPSEAVESDRIVPLLRERFDVVDERPYGESIVHPVLSSIAHNFLDEGPCKRALELLFAAEDLLLGSGEIETLRTVLVCRKRPSAGA